MVENKSRPRTVVAMIRHGEKIDNTIFDHFKYDWVAHDPILTPNGCFYAREKGFNIKKHHILEWQELVGGNFDKITVESSPYCRTMMTAANICLGMGVTEFKVNYMFSES